MCISSETQLDSILVFSTLLVLHQQQHAEHALLPRSVTISSLLSSVDHDKSKSSHFKIKWRFYIFRFLKIQSWLNLKICFISEFIISSEALMNCSGLFNCFLSGRVDHISPSSVEINCWNKFCEFSRISSRLVNCSQRKVWLRRKINLKFKCFLKIPKSFVWNLFIHIFINLCSVVWVGQLLEGGILKSSS